MIIWIRRYYLKHMTKHLCGKYTHYFFRFNSYDVHAFDLFKPVQTDDISSFTFTSVIRKLWQWNGQKCTHIPTFYQILAVYLVCSWASLFWASSNWFITSHFDCIWTFATQGIKIQWHQFRPLTPFQFNKSLISDWRKKYWDTAADFQPDWSLSIYS